MLIIHPNAHTVIKDRKGRYLSASIELTTVYGIQVDDIIGCNDLELPWQEPFATEWMELDQRVMAVGKSMHIVSGICSQGKVEYFRSYKTPLLGRGGKLQGVSGIGIPMQEKSLIPLSKQQNACLKLIALGMTNKQIARELGLSEKTVDYYLRLIKLKLEIDSRSDLMLQAIERGLLDEQY